MNGFHGSDECEFNLKLYPYPYQEKAIKTALRRKKCIIRSTTASGKSLMISYILNELKKNDWQQIIVVPTVSLVKQFRSDMISYGFKKKDIGVIYSEEKIYDRPFTISTWQSLKDRHELLGRYNTIIIDECHGVKSHELANIMKKCPAEYRMGFTGTMPSDELARMQIKSYVGPIVIDYSASYLAELGYVAKCNIKTFELNYKKEFYGDFNSIKDEVIKSPFKLNKIKEILKNADGSVLLLTTKVEKEGEVLFNWLNEQSEFKKKKIVFLSGKSKSETREIWRKECDRKSNVIIVATYGIFSTGINIKSLKHLVLASSTKSEIRTLQSIGRALRTHENKKDGAFIYDLVDNVKYLQDHAKERLYYYKQEKFNIETEKVFE